MTAPQAQRSRLVDQTLVVVGGTSGIGLATARLALEAGARVVIAGRSRARLDQSLARLGPGASGETVDAQPPWPSGGRSRDSLGSG